MLQFRNFETKKNIETKNDIISIQKNWTCVNLWSRTHHFLHADVVGEQLGDDISVGQKHIANGLRKRKINHVILHL